MSDNPVLVNQIVNQMEEIATLKAELKTMANEWQKSMDELAMAEAMIAGDDALINGLKAELAEAIDCIKDLLWDERHARKKAEKFINRKDEA
jgi:hypothetical protein